MSLLPRSNKPLDQKNSSMSTTMGMSEFFRTSTSNCFMIVLSDSSHKLVLKVQALKCTV